MRKLLALLLLAGAATPAIAAGAPGDRHGWQSHSDSDQQSASDERPNRDRPRANRGGGNDGADTNNGGDAPRRMIRVERSGGNDAPPPVTQVEPTGGGNANAARFHHGEVSRVSSGDQGAIEPVHSDGVRPSDTVRSWRGPKIVEPSQVSPRDDGVRSLRRQDRPLPNVFRNRVPVVSDTPREGTQPRLRVENRNRDRTHWTTSWRNDNRYDWQDHRRHHRSLFHLGFYYDPFGWGYRPYQIGWRLWPSYYSSRYWLSDPWQYRLPYAPPGTHWVRYYDDAVLVDTWNGEVVDVIYNFFW